MRGLEPIHLKIVLPHKQRVYRSQIRIFCGTDIAAEKSAVFDRDG
jgi:hypothetical protein